LPQASTLPEIGMLDLIALESAICCVMLEVRRSEVRAALIF